MKLGKNELIIAGIGFLLGMVVGAAAGAMTDEDEKLVAKARAKLDG